MRKLSKPRSYDGVSRFARAMAKETHLAVSDPPAPRIDEKALANITKHPRKSAEVF